MATNETMSAAEFLTKLKANDISAALSIDCMVKEAESDDSLMFAVGDVCDNWVELPAAAVDSVAVLGNVPCKDHAHPLVRLTLKPAEGPEGRMLAALLRGVMAAAGRRIAAASAAAASAPMVRPAQGLLPVGAHIPPHMTPRAAGDCGTWSGFSGVCASGCQCRDTFGTPGGYSCCDATCCG